MKNSYKLIGFVFLLTVISSNAFSNPLLFQYKGKSYGIASDSILGEAYRIDWANGLALYEVNTSKKLPSLDELLTDQLPSNSNATVSEVPATVVQLIGKRHTIPYVKNTFEVKIGSANPSVQGQALVIDNKIFGIVSRQYLKLIAGQSTRVLDWKKEKQEQGIYLLVIPNNEIKKWVLSALSNPAPKIHFSLLNGKLYSGNYKFTIGCPTEPANPGTGPGPIGGADGVGIGGEGSWVPPCEMMIDHETDFQTVWPFPHSFEEKSKLLFFVTREEGTGKLVRIPIYTYSEVIRLFSNFNYTPVTVSKPSELSPNTKLIELREKSRKLVLKAEAIYKKYPDKSIAILLKGLHMLGHVLNSDQWSITRSDDIYRFQDLKGEFTQAWQNLEFPMEAEKNALQSMLTDLISIRKELGE